MLATVSFIPLMSKQLWPTFENILNLTALNALSSYEKKYMSNRINPFGFKMWTQIRNNYHGATHTRRSRDVSSGLKRRQHKNDIIYTPLSEPLILKKPEIVEEVWTQTWSCIGTKSVVRTRYKFLLTSKFAYWRYIRYFNAVVTFAPSGLAMTLYEDTTWLTPISN